MEWTSITPPLQAAILAAIFGMVSGAMLQTLRWVANRPILASDEATQIRKELRDARDYERSARLELEHRCNDLARTVSRLENENRACMEIQSKQRTEIDELQKQVKTAEDSLTDIRAEVVVMTKQRDEWESRAVALEAQITRALQRGMNEKPPLEG